MVITSSTEAKRNLGSLIDSAQNEPVVIERHGHRVAVIVDYNSFMQMSERQGRPKRQLGTLSHIPIDVDALLDTPLPEFDGHI